MPRVIWTHLGDCDRQRTAALLALNAPDQGVVSLPGIVDSHATSGVFARDLLAALGKPPHISGNGAHSIDPWTIVPIWFTAAGIEHLIVVDAQRLGAGRVADLISFACETRTTLWLLTHDTLRGIWERGLDDWPVEQVPWADAETQLPAVEHPEPDTRPRPPFSFADLPASDLWTFRADCQRTVSPERFAAIDALLTTAADDAASWGATSRTAEDIESRIVDLIAEHSTLGERLVALRGFQVGMLRCGWHVGVAYDGFASFAGEHPGRLLHDGDHRWERLSRWWQPHRGAVCALVALGIPAPDVAELKMADVTHTVVHTSTGDVPVPAPAQAPIVAQRLARLAEGASGDDPFFVRGDSSDGGEWVRELVSAAVDAGAVVPLPADGSRQRWHNARDVTRRLGLRFNALGDLALTAPTPTSATATAKGTARRSDAPPSSADPGRDVAAVLDGGALGRRRLELGLTRRLLSRQVGVNEAVVFSLERGEIPPLMRASHLVRYAEALGIHPAEVLGGLPPDQPAASVADDGAALGALLWSCEQAVPAVAAADALEWSSDRVAAAAESLDGALRPCGLRLLHGAGELSIVAEASAVPPSEVVAAVVRRQQLRASVALHRVKLLLEIANDTFRANRNANPGTLAHLRFLQRAEMIDFPDGSAGPSITEDVAVSLLLRDG